MSHTQKIRQEIADKIPKTDALRRCMLFGLLIDARVDEESTVAVFSSEEARTCAVKLSKILFGANASLTESTLAGRTSYRSEFSSRKLSEALNKRRANFKSEEKTPEEIEYILRGAFLQTGRINDPMAQSHMEFSFSYDDLAHDFLEFLELNDLPIGGCSHRRNKSVVYFKSNEKICDMLSAMGVGNILFEYINTGIYRDIGNSEHRATNCISGNINRAVIAGSRHRASCEYLIEHVGEGEIDSGLRTTAILRIENPTVSLSELAELHVPPLTKSGINHRLKKIAELAEKYGFRE